MPTTVEIDDAMQACLLSEAEGCSSWPGMTYEQGVAAAIAWMRGEGPNPMED